VSENDGHSSIYIKAITSQLGVTLKDALLEQKLTPREVPRIKLFCQEDYTKVRLTTPQLIKITGTQVFRVFG
jgi:hypothetical protein